MSVMPSGKEPVPGSLARAISEDVRLSMAKHRVSGTRLAKMIGKSQSYVSKRLRDEASFTLNDFESLCDALGDDLGSCLVAIARRVPHGGSGSK